MAALTLTDTDRSSALDLRRPQTVPADRPSASQRQARRDVELVRRFKDGDEDAFVEIMTHYREPLFSVAFGLLKNHADADEIAQDAFICAHRGLANFRGDSSLATWLNRIALNLARNRYWYFFRRRRHATVSFDQAFNHDNVATLADTLASEAPSPARTVALNEFSDLVAVCIERLSPEQREILTLRSSLHRSYSQIAAGLGISSGTVKSRISRARENLRAIMNETCPDMGLEPQPTLGPTV